VKMTSQSHSPSPEDLLAHAEWARALARRLVGDASTADDVVQDTWVAALRRPPRAGDPVRPWLGRVLANVVHQRQRAEGRRTHRERQASRGEALPSAAELTQRTEAQRSLMDAILELDEQLRTVVLLRYFEGLSSAEIARRQGVPAGTVRWRLKRGLDELRVILEERAGGRGADWCAALVPLLRVPPRSAVATMGTGATLKALISMKLSAKTLAIAVFLVGGAFLLKAAGVLTWSGPTPREAVQFRPLELSAAPALLDASAPSPEAEPEAARAAISDPVSEPPSGALPNPTVRARFVDAGGVPVAGVRAELWPTREPAVAASGPDGRVVVQGDLYGGNMGAELRFAHPRHASDKVEFASAERDLDLGDLVLHPGGALHGTVLDPEGLPLAGCEIEVYGREVSENSVGGLRSSRRSGLGAARTTTDVQGQFSLGGLLAGDVQVLAEMPDELHKGTSGLVEVRAGEESYGLVIVAEAIPQSDRIEGVVLDPDGQPIPRASVSARYRSLWSSGSIGVTADLEGRFRILVRSSADHELTAEDPRDRWGPVRLAGVEPGDLDVELRFADLGSFQVRLVDASGRPLERASLSVRTADGDDFFEWRSNIALDEGQASLRLPAEPFQLEVIADGYDRLSAGPFSPSSLSGVLEFELESLPGLTGTVTADGRPLEGVSLTVHRRARGRTLNNGFPVHFEPQPVSRATSDAEGRFTLTVRESGSYVLRAAPSGSGALLAPTELELPDVNPKAGHSGITLELGPGGVLEGRVVAPAGGRASTVVAISRGDGNARTQRVPAGGTFRFEGLTPGRWLVVRRETELASGSSSTSSDSSTPWRELPWSCEVFEGRTTIHDLVLGEAETARLEGHLTLDQPLPGDCVAALIPLEDDAENMVSGSSDGQLDREGAFALDALEGRYRLTVSLGSGAPVLLEELTIGAGTTTWNRELETGALTIEGLAPPTDTDAAPLLLVWEGAGGLWALAPLTADEEGRAHVPLFPAGSVRVVRAVRGLGGDPRAFPVLLELEVSAGETTNARLDG